MKLRIAQILSTFFGIGYFPVAPGTVTSAVVALLFFFVPVLHSPTFLFALLALCTVVGVWAGGVMEEHFGNDPSIVTIDEVAGQLLTLAFMPEGWLPLLISFAMFRFFDIAKPGAIDAAQRLPGGWGIMVDDLLAGLFANLSTRAVLGLLAMFHHAPVL